MVMTDSEARDRLHEGLGALSTEQPKWQRRQDYVDGKQDMPYAPPGVNAEYESLQRQAIANWLDIAMKAPLQRLVPEGFATGRGKEPDADAWDNVWQPNSLDSRADATFTDMMVHGRGIMSVWPDGDTPRIRPESGLNVHVEGDPEDPWTQLWAVKRVTRKVPASQTSTALILPPGYRVPGSSTIETAWVHDRDSWRRYERGNPESREWVRGGDWVEVDSGTHRLGHVAFVPFDNRPTSSAVPRSDLEPLMPMQDAINTIRFQTLLAMQFSAYRQRIIVGFDPVLRDADGNVIPQRDGNGNVLLDQYGQPMPILQTPGRPGVDRMLVFPGDLTKVFDMPESDMGNYVTVLGEFLTQFFAIAQVPPQYLLSRMANLSGDALTGAESTLNAKVKQLQTAAGESLELVMRMAHRARGGGDDDVASEVQWAQSEVRSFAATVDAIAKLIASGMAPRDAWAMLPGATPPKIEQWERNANRVRDERMAAVAALPTPDPEQEPPADSAAGDRRAIGQPGGGQPTPPPEQ
jgi:hypothetical protein